ncbi:MAG: UDP-glucose 4-epimerase [Alphaproteobacteria bacterium]|nr:MAG: UDP-glucose 4-epimerase [Alphaproteobacteria bacterium]
MRIGVTGAGGFVGSGLVAALLARGRLAADRPPITRIVAADRDVAAVADARVVALAGDIADPDFRARLFEQPYDAFFHLAAVPGGAAAADYRLGWRVNVEATVALLEALAAQRRPARLVFSSSIGVFGVPLPSGAVDDDTLPLPSMSYGTQKLIGEALVADFARRGLLDGLALRLPGIVARPRVAGGHLSAYLSDIFHALAAGEAFTCPVSAGAASWFMSRARCIDNLIHAAALPAHRLGARRAFNLPALRLTMAELVEALADRFGPRVRDRIAWQPEDRLEAQFGAYPPLLTPIADRLGFAHDGDAAALVARALDLTTRVRSHGGTNAA